MVIVTIEKWKWMRMSLAVDLQSNIHLNQILWVTLIGLVQFLS